MAKKTPRKSASTDAKSTKKSAPLEKFKAPPIIEGIHKGEKSKWRADQVIVRLAAPKPSKEIAIDLHASGNKKKQVPKFDSKLMKSLCASLLKKIKNTKILYASKNHYKILLAVPEDTNPEAFCEALLKLPEVQSASLNHIISISLAPNDFVYVNRFDFRDNQGNVLLTEAGHWSYKRIGMEAAWDLVSPQGANALLVPNSNVLIGTVDSGISLSSNDPAVGQLDHSDLNENIRIQLGTNFLDPGKLPRDDNSHGTHVAGTIGAKTNNGVFVSAINWGAVIHVCKAFGGPNGTGESHAMSESVREITDAAIAQNKKAVINMSVRGPGFLSADAIIMEDFNYALENGVLIVAASGNDSHNDANPPTIAGGFFPAKLAENNPSVIAVGATKHDDSLSDFSNTGPELSVVAPGEFIVSSHPTYACVNTITNADGTRSDVNTSLNFGIKAGTSMATPHVTGLASLLWNHVPFLSAAEVANVLKFTAKDMGVQDANGRNDQFGFGQIDAAKAVAQCGRELVNLPNEIRFEDVIMGNPQTQEFTFQLLSFHATEIRVELTTNVAISRFVLENSNSVANNVSSLSLSFPATNVYEPRDITIQITYVPSVAGEEENATLTVSSVSGGIALQSIPVQGNTFIAPETFGYELVLDRSGSMSATSGVPGLTRMEVLKRATQNTIDVLLGGDSLGITSFSTDATDDYPLTQFGDPGVDLERALASNIVDALTPGGSTSIGDGLITGSQALDTGAVDHKAIIVFTDGIENAPTSISTAHALLDPAIKVFAIGMGTEANIDVAKLSSITDSTGGMLFITGNDVNNFDNWLSKISVIALAHASGEAIINDPSGSLLPGHKITLPFVVSDEESRIDIMLFCPYKDAFDFELIDPSGKKYSPRVHFDAGSYFFSGENIMYYRLEIPVNDPSFYGVWKAQIATNPKTVKKNKKNKSQKVNYTFMVKAKTSIVPAVDHIKVHLGEEDEIKFKTSLHRNGSPMRTNLRIKTYFSSNNRLIQSSIHHTIGNGKLDLKGLEHNGHGVYQIRQVIEGKTKKGYAFTREIMRSICVKNPSFQNLKPEKNKKIKI